MAVHVYYTLQWYISLRPLQNNNVKLKNSALSALENMIHDGLLLNFYFEFIDVS